MDDDGFCSFHPPPPPPLSPFSLQTAVVAAGEVAVLDLHSGSWTQRRTRPEVNCLTAVVATFRIRQRAYLSSVSALLCFVYIYIYICLFLVIIVKVLTKRKILSVKIFLIFF